jgi:DNA polymerase III delta subunit
MAVPAPNKEMARLDKLLRGGLPPVVLLHGVSAFFRERAMERALNAVPKDAELRKVDGLEVRATDEDGEGAPAAAAGVPELQDLRGGGLFASCTVVAVRRGANWWRKHGAAVAEVAPKIQPGSCLVVEAAKLDKRKKAAATLFKQLSQEGAVFEFRDLYDTPYDRSQSPLQGELCQWVVQASGKLGVRLTPESAWLLISQVGKSPSELVAEVQRLRDVLGEDAARAPLKPEDLRGKLTVSFESTPFEFTEAVLGGDRRAAQRSLTAMFARGVRQQDGKAMDTGGVLPFTASWLFRQIGVVYEGRAMFEEGVSSRDLPSRCNVRQFQDRFLRNVQQNDLPQLQRGITALHACQRKSRLFREDPEVLLERFLAQWFDGAPIETAEELEL